MQNFRVALVWLAIALAIGSSAESRASQIGLVDFQILASGVSNETTASGAAVLGASGNVWNVSSGGAGAAVAGISPLLYVDGATSSGLSLSFSDHPDYNGGSGLNSPANPFSNYGFLGSCCSATTTSTITISGFAPGVEVSDLIFYAGVSGQGGVFTIGPTTYSTNGDGDSSGYVNATTTGIGNYVDFQNITPVGGSITIDWSIPATQGYAGLSGMQINMVAVPEPASAVLLLLGFGAAGLGWMARRRRRPSRC